MEIRNIKLKNFRNHRQFQESFTNNLNVIIGPNGSGKSSIIEAIALLASTKSFRSANFRNLIYEGLDYALSEGELSDKKLRIIISNNGKQFYCDQTAIKSSSDFIGLFQAIVFTSADLLFVNDPPKTRRRFIDSELSKINRYYLLKLSEYNILLKNRNALLKGDKIDEALLDVFDSSMSELMAEIWQLKQEYILDINKHFTQKLQNLLSEKAFVKLKYNSSCQELNKEEIKEQLINYRMRDILSKQTNFGIHRDDYQINFNDHPAQDYCSSGQIRLIMLALKLTLVELVQEKTKEKPVILLDDVLSELDLQHQKKLLDLVCKDNQTIITTTHLESLLKEMDKKVIELKRRD